MIRVLSSMLGLLLSTAIVSVALAAAPAASPSTAADPHPKVAITTSEGVIVVELDRTKAPISVENFLSYVNEGHYNGTIFHRVIDNFMIQGGGYSEDFQRKPTHDPITNEANNGLKNVNGSIAMARTSDPHSATAQFFINVADNGFLDFTGESTSGWGYTVFGRVIEGMDTVDKILALPTGSGGPLPKDVPQKTVLIISATVVGAANADTNDDATSEAAATAAPEAK